MSEKKKRRSFDLSYKLKVLKYAEENSGEAAARKFGLDPKSIRQWKEQKTSLLNSTTGTRKQNVEMSKRKRLKGGGAKRISEEMDDILMDWILDLRTKSLRVSRRSIREKARQLFPTLQNVKRSDFKASAGWLDKFLKRNGLSYRRRTTVGQKDPEDLMRRIVSYVMYISKVKDETGPIAPANIIAMDETSVWFDMLSNTTVKKGDKTVQLKSTGHEKAHATVALAARGDGSKLEPYVVFKKSVREVKKLQDTTRGAVISTSSNGWMNDDLTMDWLDKVFKSFTFGKRILAWDSYKCHISDSTKKHFRKFNSKVVVIPGGCTKYIQAPDLCWNRPFKAHLQVSYDNWLQGKKDKTFTKGGNMRAATKELLINWTKDAWNSLSPDMIRASFESCGLTIASDGSEDDKIHCLKQIRLCFPAMEFLKTARLESNEEELELFVDGNEDEENEMLIDLSDDEEDSPSPLDKEDEDVLMASAEEVSDTEENLMDYQSNPDSD